MYRLVEARVVRQVDHATVRVEKRYVYSVKGKLLRGRSTLICHVPNGVVFDKDDRVELRKIAPVSKRKHFLAVRI